MHSCVPDQAPDAGQHLPRWRRKIPSYRRRTAVARRERSAEVPARQAPGIANRTNLDLGAETKKVGKYFNDMPSFSFHLCTPGNSRAIQNCRHEFPDLGAAMAEANRIGCSMIRQQAPKQPCQLRSHLDVRDEGEALVARILLAELAHQIS